MTSASKTAKEEAQWFMGRVMAGHTITSVQKIWRAQLLRLISLQLSTVCSFLEVNLQFVHDKTSEIEVKFPGVRAVLKADVEVIVKSCLTESTGILQSLIVQSVKSMFEDVLQASYFHFNNNAKYAKFIAGIPALGKLDRSGCTPIQSEALMCNLVQPSG